MEEQLTQLGAEDFELPNNNLETAYEFFLNNYLHPIDIAVELFDFPEVINNPFDDYEFKNAFNNHLISKKQLEDYAVIFLLNQKFEKYAQSRSIQQTDFKTSLDHRYQFPENGLLLIVELSIAKSEPCPLYSLSIYTR